MRTRVRHFNPANAGCPIALDARFLSLADNASVASWPSRPGGLYGATAAGAAQPTYKAASINGRAAVQFNGTGNVMTFDAGSLALFNGASGGTAVVVVVVDNTGADATQTAFHFSSGTSAGPVRFNVSVFSGTVAGAATNGRRLDADSAAGTARASGATTSPVIVQGFADWAGGVLNTRTNGGTATTGSFSSGAGTVSATNSVASKLGALDAATNRLSGRIAAICIAGTLLPASLRMMIRQHYGFSFRIFTA